jgi:hypothetical protein
LRDPRPAKHAELNGEDTKIEDLTVSEDTSFEVKGADGEVGDCRISSFNFMKKVAKI